MIDKSIRQYYQDGEKVDSFTGGKKTIWPEKFTTEQGKVDYGKVAKTAGKHMGTSYLKRAAAKKLGVASINPLIGLLSLVMPWMKAKWGKEGAFKAFQAGMTGTQADYEAAKELRVLEKRRDYMLRRRDEGKKFSQKNLDEVTAQINRIKKTSPIIDYETEAYGAPDTIKDIIDEQYEFEDKKTQQFRDPIITSLFPGEDELATDTIADIRAQEKTEAERTMQETIREAEKQAAFDRVVAENKAKAEAETAAQRAYAARIPERVYHAPITGGGRDQPSGGGGGQAAADRAGGSAYSSPFKKGGRVDKALGGRSRDIG